MSEEFNAEAIATRNAIAVDGRVNATVEDWNGLLAYIDRLQQENAELKDKTMKLTTTMYQLRDYLSDIEYDLDQADSLFTLKDEIALIDKALTIDHKE